MLIYIELRKTETIISIKLISSCKKKNLHNYNKNVMTRVNKGVALPEFLLAFF